MKKIATFSERMFYLNRALIVSLFAWAIIASVGLIQMRPKPLLIGLDENGTRVISKSDDPLFEKETINFLRTFIHLTYNYESSTFWEQVGNSTGLMSRQLWESKEAELKSLAEKVKVEPIQSFSTLEKIVQSDDGTYVATISLLLTQRYQKETKRLEVRLKLVSVKRTEKNPWGIEVSSLDEKIL